MTKTVLRLLAFSFVLAAGFVTVPWLSGDLRAQALISSFKTDKLSINTAAGENLDFKVELATTLAERMQGLMFRRNLAPDAGMLFDFQNVAPVTMWMKNTFIPLDMVFIAADGRIVNIAQRTVPHSLTPVPSRGPVRAVLELAGGVTEKLGIRPGDIVHYHIFKTNSPAR